MRLETLSVQVGLGSTWGIFSVDFRFPGNNKILMKGLQILLVSWQKEGVGVEGEAGVFMVHNDMGEGVWLHFYLILHITSSAELGKLIWISLTGEGLASRIYFSKQDRLAYDCSVGEGVSLHAIIAINSSKYLSSSS